MFAEETSWLASSSLYTSLDGLPWCVFTGRTADRWQLPPCHSRPQKEHLATMSDALGMEISYCWGWWGVPIPFVLQRLVPTCLPVRMQNVGQVWAVLCSGVKRSPGFLLHHFRFSLCHQVSAPQAFWLVLELWACVLLHSWTWHFNVRAHTNKKKKRKQKRRRAHTNTLTGFREAVGEPECRAWGLLCLWCLYCLLCCPSACRRLLHTYASVQPCIINSDCCGQQVAVQESCKGRKGWWWGGGKDRRRRKKESLSIPFPPYICSHSTFFSFRALLWSFILKPLPPWVTSCQTARGGCRLSSYPLFSHFFGIWDTHRSAPRESFGNPR